MRQDDSGIFEGFIPGVGKGTRYKYHIVSGASDYRADKGDPYAFYWETSPNTASIVWDLDHDWGDADWMATRKDKNGFSAPVSIYEVHLGSFRRVHAQRYRSLSYLELADHLTEHVLRAGFSHVELLPIMPQPATSPAAYGSGRDVPPNRSRSAPSKPASPARQSRATSVTATLTHSRTVSPSGPPRVKLAG